MAKMNFDPSQHEDAQGFGPLPTDVDFHWEIGESDLTTPKSGEGSMLKLRLNVLGPSHEGRCVFDRLNIVHANADAERIAGSNLKMLCNALGIAKLEDSDELIGGQFLARCKTEPAKNGYEAKSVLDYSTVQPLGGAPAQAPKPAAAKPAGGKPAPAWARSKAA